MMSRLYDKAAAPKEKFVVTGAGHADAKRKDPAVYFDKIFTFLEDKL